MPTAAKLVAAILFAILGYVAAMTYRAAILPEGQPATWLEPVCAALGIWQGWRCMGRLVGQGLRSAMGNGIRTSVQLTALAVAGFGIAEMFRRSARLAYDHPEEAFMAALQLIIDYAATLLQTPQTIGVLLIGGILSGIITELANRRWL